MDHNDPSGDEAKRLRVLQSLQMLNTPPELAFDLIARAARSAVQSDSGFVAFVGAEDIWFKAAAGQEAAKRPRVDTFCDRVVRTGAPVVVENVAAQAACHGTEWVGAYAGAPIRVQGQIVGTVCVTSRTPRPFTATMLSQLDFLALIVAERLETRREKLFLSQLFEGTSDAVLIVDEAQVITHWNAAAEALFGYSAEEAIGQLLTMIVPPHLRADHNRGFSRLCHGGQPTLHGEIEVPALRRDGTLFPASLALSIWLDSDRIMVGAIIRDISERAALNQVRVASEAKTRFLANMSHEIRTPLNGILGLGDVLSRTRLDPDQFDLLRSMTGAARTLQGLLSDVLDLARLEEGALQLIQEPFDLSALVREVGLLHRPSAEAKGLDYQIQVPATAQWVTGDGLRLKQVLGNLLSNGVKFTNAGVVSLVVEEQSEGWSFEVTDTGIGFDEAAKCRIFERFAQADDSITRRYGGSGLGLSICVDLVQAMGGELEAFSVLGQGARFVFQLPLAKAQAPAGAAVGPGLHERGLRVLLAEDHPINRKVIEMILGEVGVDLVAVCDGRQAVDAFVSQTFDLVLMDMQMPVLDGLTATRQIRAHERLLSRRACPIIMLTANVLPEHLRASFEAGADRHLGKPIEARGLLTAIDDVLGADVDVPVTGHGQQP